MKITALAILHAGQPYSVALIRSGVTFRNSSKGMTRPVRIKRNSMVLITISRIRKLFLCLLARSKVQWNARSVGMS